LAIELELKSVVTDPAALRRGLEQAGAVQRFHGMMRDRRLDRSGELSGRDEVLRVRLWSADAGTNELAEVAWKGPTGVSPDGYKHREELELGVDNGPVAVRLLEALGYRVVESIDRYVEVFELDDTVARLEWYPRMDVLLEIEGPPAGIERVVGATGLRREGCVADPLARFAERYTQRTGRPAILAEAGLGTEAPGWADA
jgi:adenylate cyclase class IV